MDEVIHRRTGLSPTAEHLLKQATEITWGTTVDIPSEALRRIKAWWVAMEVLGWCSLSSLAPRYDPAGRLTACTGGPLDLLQVIEDERAAHPNLPALAHIMGMDTKARELVHSLMTSDRDNFPTISFALHELLRRRTLL